MLYSNRSAARLGRGLHAKALEDAERCIELNATWPKGYGRKGAALHAMKRYDDAIAAYDAGLQVDAGNAALTAGKADVEREKSGPSMPAGGAAGMCHARLSVAVALHEPELVRARFGA